MRNLFSPMVVLILFSAVALPTVQAQIADLNDRPGSMDRGIPIGLPDDEDEDSDEPAGVLDVYVDAVTGDDANDGLTQDTAKKTIRGGVNAIPEVLNDNVTVHIADGIYQEDLAWITARGRRGPWGISLIGNPAHPENVILDGTSVQDEIGISVSDPYVQVRGLTFSHYADAGITVIAGGRLELSRCRFVDNDQAWAAIDVNGGSAEIEDCEILRNSTGVRARGGGQIRFFNDLGTVVDLNDVGLLVETNSSIEMRPPCLITNSPLEVHDQSMIKGYGACARDGVSACLEVDPPAWCADGP